MAVHIPVLMERQNKEHRRQIAEIRKNLHNSCVPFPLTSPSWLTHCYLQGGAPRQLASQVEQSFRPAPPPSQAKRRAVIHLPQVARCYIRSWDRSQPVAL